MTTCLFIIMTAVAGLTKVVFIVVILLLTKPDIDSGSNILTEPISVTAVSKENYSVFSVLCS